MPSWSFGYRPDRLASSIPRLVSAPRQAGYQRMNPGNPLTWRQRARIVASKSQRRTRPRLPVREVGRPAGSHRHPLVPPSPFVEPLSRGFDCGRPVTALVGMLCLRRRSESDVASWSGNPLPTHVRRRGMRCCCAHASAHGPPTSRLAPRFHVTRRALGSARRDRTGNDTVRHRTAGCRGNRLVVCPG